MARPSEFSQEKADYICEELAEGRSLRSICNDETMPAASTVCRWLAQNDEFRKQYAHARELQADALFDESLDIADDDNGDLVAEKEKDATVVRGNSVAVQRARLRIDTRKWMAGKLRPKVYGDKLDLEASGNAVGLIVFKGLNATGLNEDG
jgi:hypothetical protein